MRTFRIEIWQYLLASTVTLVAGFWLPAHAGSTAEIASLVEINTSVDKPIEDFGSIKQASEFPDISDAASYLMRGRKITVDIGGALPPRVGSCSSL